MPYPSVARRRRRPARSSSSSAFVVVVVFGGGGGGGARACTLEVVLYERTSGWRSKASGGVERRRGRGS
jgi:hypothetical protein